MKLSLPVRHVHAYSGWILYGFLEEKDDAEDEDGGFLVDFHQKAYENMLQKRAEERERQEGGDVEDTQKKERERAELEEDIKCLQEPLPEPEDPDDEW